MDSIHISVAPEVLFHLGNLAVTNSLLTTFIVSIFLIILAVKSTIKIGKQTKLQMMMELIIEEFYKFFKQILGGKTKSLFPILFTFFIFIIFASWVGLLPGIGSIGLWEEIDSEMLLVPLFRAPNADLNVTIALALVSVIVTQYLSIKALGAKKFAGRYINIKSPIDFIVGFLEIISEFSKILSFSFRLFGNIFAGEVLLVVMTFLIPILVPVPFFALEVFVGFIQAIVFTMLTSIFISIATEEHH